jgi:glycosyltransferase involved in cell wall biosynthesis
VVFLIGTSAGGTGAHVRMLAAGLAARGADVRVAGPPQTGADLGLDAIPNARFTPVQFGDRPRPGDVNAVLALRRMLTAPGSAPDVVHAHGMRAGALAALALLGAGGTGGTRTGVGGIDVGTAGRGRRPRLVVTVHNAPPPGEGAARLIYVTLEQIVARRADLVLAVSSDLEHRMRAAGARQVARAVVPAPVRSGTGAGTDTGAGTGPDTGAGAGAVTAAGRFQRSGRASEDGRPLVLAVGRLAPQKDFAVLIAAARAWQSRTPKPRLVIAGAGPLESDLRSQAAAQSVDVEFPGRVGDVPELLQRADVFVVPSRWEGQPLVLQEALRAGAPIVATRTGGIPDLTGDDAALLVPPGDPAALAEAIARVLTDPALSIRLRASATQRAETLPTEDDAVAAVLHAYERALQ